MHTLRGPVVPHEKIVSTVDRTPLARSRRMVQWTKFLWFTSRGPPKEKTVSMNDIESNWRQYLVTRDPPTLWDKPVINHRPTELVFLSFVVFGETLILLSMRGVWVVSEITSVVHSTRRTCPDVDIRWKGQIQESCPLGFSDPRKAPDSDPSGICSVTHAPVTSHTYGIHNYPRSSPQHTYAQLLLDITALETSTYSRNIKQESDTTLPAELGTREGKISTEFKRSWKEDISYRTDLPYRTGQRVPKHSQNWPTPGRTGRKRTWRRKERFTLNLDTPSLSESRSLSGRISYEDSITLRHSVHSFTYILSLIPLFNLRTIMNLQNERWLENNDFHFPYWVWKTPVRKVLKNSWDMIFSNSFLSFRTIFKFRQHNGI